eukprot:TRINITY_DN1324_c0_g1_i1.p2 TRINITY_DN1324_c0_g1~~TRINITY_DN1324_c0_g1_i1.p2  ORF type:complete len:111 (+),score=33.41 TRINITY_DN1324_c0_g1_i1:742-1074(+)
MLLSYQGGPILVKKNDEGLPAVRTVGRYSSDAIKMLQDEAPENRKSFFENDLGKMPGSLAMTCTTYHNGRVYLFSPHPELSGAEFLLREAANWVKYDPDRPAENKKCVIS